MTDYDGGALLDEVYWDRWWKKYRWPIVFIYFILGLIIGGTVIFAATRPTPTRPLSAKHAKTYVLSSCLGYVAIPILLEKEEHRYSLPQCRRVAVILMSGVAKVVEPGQPLTQLRHSTVHQLKTITDSAYVESSSNTAGILLLLE